MANEDNLPRSVVLRQALRRSKQADSSVTAMLTVLEACAYLRISKWTFYQLIRKKEIKSLKIRSRRLIRMQSVLEFLERVEAETEV
jgi:excisionase family DNA binding protein